MKHPQDSVPASTCQAQANRCSSDLKEPVPRSPGSCAAWGPSTGLSATVTGVSCLVAICQMLMSKWTCALDPQGRQPSTSRSEGSGYSPAVPVPRTLQSSLQVWGPDSDTGLPFSQFPFAAVEQMPWMVQPVVGPTPIGFKLELGSALPPPHSTQILPSPTPCPYQLCSNATPSRNPQASLLLCTV